MSILQQVWSILLPAERQRAALVLLLMLAATALEMLSVGLVVPVLAFMTSDASALPPTSAGTPPPPPGWRRSSGSSSSCRGRRSNCSPW